MITDDWHGLYAEGWQGEIDPDAFSHPAKYARALIRHIYDHCITEGWLKAGDVVLDPFGGVALGARDAAAAGVFYIGIELEPRFVALAHRNFARWAERDWCTCGNEGNAYLRAVRESLRERVGGNEQDETTQERPVLQPGMPEQLSLEGLDVERGDEGETEGAHALEQGQAVVDGSEGEVISEGQQRNAGDGKERPLERREIHPTRRLRGGPSQRAASTGTRSRNGATPRAVADAGGDCTPQEWQSAGQPDREPGTDDHIGTHEDSSRNGDSPASQDAYLCSVRQDFRGETQRPFVLRTVQAATAARVRAETRRQTEGKFCRTCGKLIVPFPVLLQGDSRRLAAIVERAGVAVSSPPYAETELRGGGTKNGQGYTGGQRCLTDYGDTEGQLGAMPAGDFAAALSSPPYNLPMSQDHNGSRGGQRGTEPSEAGAFVKYGSTPGQLEGLAMTEGGLQAAISSPPFTDTEGSHAARKYADPEKVAEDIARKYRDGTFKGHPASKEAILRSLQSANEQTYGTAPGNLGNLPAGDFAAAVASPPYEGNYKSDRTHDDRDARKFGGRFPGQGAYRGGSETYGDTVGQLGAEAGTDFWTAARAVVEQVYSVLAPGGHAVWVVKAFVRNKQLVDFPGQWRQLCEAVGFVTLHEHRAWVVEDRGAQHTIWGEVEERKVSRKSFFRRLAEKNGSPAIDWETVWCMMKPEA